MFDLYIPGTATCNICMLLLMVIHKLTMYYVELKPYVWFWHYYTYIASYLDSLFFHSFHLWLGPPPPPTGLNVTVDGSRAKIAWNSVEGADFYRVEVYAAKSCQLFHFSNETETQKQVILCQSVSCLSTMQFVVNIRTCDRCGQWSKVAASTKFFHHRK